MKFIKRDQLYLLIFVIIIFLVGAGLLFWQKLNTNVVISGSVKQPAVKNNSTVKVTPVNKNEKEEEAKKDKAKIIVHVAGEVKNTGVYTLKGDVRVIDAVKAAGGKTKKADLDKINLAANISDGQKIYIPSHNEKSENINLTGNSYSQNNDFSNKININTAGIDRLTELTGIGSTKAKSILDYRNKNGEFTDITDLLEVNGIGEKTLESVKNDIIVKKK
ncbi:MAG: helix-hairpin-helix domain-containing protein [Halanaerobiales bacterium]